MPCSVKYTMLIFKVALFFRTPALGEQMEQDKFAIEQVEAAQADFTSLGRWGWGLAVTFLTQILFKSLDTGGNLFPDIRCPKGGEIGWPFLGVILIGGGVYWYFVLYARVRVEKSITYAHKVQGDLERAKTASPTLNYTLDNAPTGRRLRWAMVLRGTAILALLGTWAAVFEVGDAVWERWASVKPEKCRVSEPFL